MAFERQGGVLQLLGDGHQGGAGLVEPQPFGQAIEQGGSAENCLESGNTPTNGRLAYAEGATGRAQRAVPRHREKDAGVVPIEQPGAVGAVDHDTLMYRCVSEIGNARSVNVSLRWCDSNLSLGGRHAHNDYSLGAIARDFRRKDTVAL